MQFVEYNVLFNFDKWHLASLCDIVVSINQSVLKRQL